MIIEFDVERAQEGMRLDRCVSENSAISRSRVQELIAQGKVIVNGAGAKSSLRLAEGDHIRIDHDEPAALDVEAQDIPLDIRYEDEDVIVINKPRGMVVHPAAGNQRDTLVNALLYHCRDLSGINGVLRPGIVHRIDKDTTGSVLVCKNDASHRSIAQQLKDHSIVRRYRAIVCGNLQEEEGTIDAPIGRDPGDRKKMAINRKNGKEAVTHYRILQRFTGYTYIECRLETGRTHQIRVHMASLGHPLLGDAVYGPKKCPFPSLEGQTLHAMILGFVQPTTGEYIETCAPLPDYFEHLLRIL